MFGYIKQGTSVKKSQSQINNSSILFNMKVFVVLAGLISLVLSEAPYPASGWKPSGALLVLPPRQQQFSRFESQPSNQQQQQVPTAYGPPAQPDNNNQGEASDNGNNNVAAAGPTETGAYYVLLPDGRLQKIQYSAQNSNPAKSSQTPNQDAFTQQRFQSSSNFNQFQDKQFGKQSSFNQHSFQSEKFSHSNENLGFGQATNNVNSFQKFNREQNLQQNSFQSQQNFAKTATSTGAPSKQPEAVHKSATNAQDEQKAGKLVAQFSEAQLKANGPLPDGYVASVMFSDVPPITAPVYVFNSAPLVRVLRMAPQYV